jgi:hypothetical protein
MPTQNYGNRPDFMAAVDVLLTQQLPSIADDATPVLLEVEATHYMSSTPASELSWQHAAQEVRRLIEESALGKIQITLRAANVTWSINWFYNVRRPIGRIGVSQQ